MSEVIYLLARKETSKATL